MALATFSQRIHALPMSIFLGAATAGVVLAPPAAAAVHVKYIEVPQCRPNTNQLCPQEPEIRFTAGHNEGIDARFTVNANHCSDILVRFLIDHYAQGNFMRVGPTQTVSGGFIIKSGDPVLSVQAKGIAGGCNTGVLNAWGGTVHLDSEDAVGPAPHQVP